MDGREALKLLQEAHEEAYSVMILPHNHPNRDLWYYKVLDILKAGFGPESEEYHRFVECVPQGGERRGTPSELQELSDKRLQKRATALLSVIEKYKLRGVETAPAEGDENTRTELENFLRKLKRFRQNRSRIGERGDTKSLEKPREELIRISAKLSNVIAPPDGKLLMTQFGHVFDAFDAAFMLDWLPEPFTALDALIRVTNDAIGRLEARPAIAEHPTAIAITEPPKAFIAHGKESPALIELRDFLDAMGLQPLIVEDQPSKGKAVDDKVEHYLGQADCAIILATADDEIAGKSHPRQNVIHEIGLAQKTFPERIIYLLEENAEFPSNVSPKVWQRFTQESMAHAFIAVARELTAFGIIRAVKP